MPESISNIAIIKVKNDKETYKNLKNRYYSRLTPKETTD